MHIDLTESLACPVCPPGQGLVAIVEEISDRRIQRGALGCPSCERRYPIRGGDVRFDAAAAGGPIESRPVEGVPDEPGPRDGSPDGSRPAEGGRDEVAITVAALLALEEGEEGVVLLGRGLGGVAPALARLAPSAEVIVLIPDPEEASGRRSPGDGGSASDPPPGKEAPGDLPRPTRFHGVEEARLPFVSGRLRGVAFRGGSPEAIREAVRILASRGRLAVLRPAAAVSELLGSGGGVEGLEILAKEERAAVAVRR